MLQFITKPSDRWSIIKESEMVLNGGCRWIQLGGSEIGDSFTLRRDTAEKLIPLCRDNEAFLIIEDDIDMVDELKVHGVFLRDCTRSNVQSARERLGAEAVIGVAARTVEDIENLRGLDIDYVTIEAPSALTSSEAILNFFGDIISRVDFERINFHLVAKCDCLPELLPQYIVKGYAGVAISNLVADAEDPTVAVSTILKLLDQARIEKNGVDADSICL